ncbi:MAG TPA: type II toxin-antitoxin system HicA family toxin [Thermodesulfobacteriota bacterium]|nr:type II toxin-antitoxin system HicA family toxin [Thermodesulfobacteriota bacterium]HLE17533.1 type II toxin-antitoxin system HicA family toxin [Syntrophales bacterium]
MPRLTPVHWKKLKSVFEKAGFGKERETDSHIILSKPEVPRPIVIPKYNDVGIDIIKSNMRSAGMTREEYFKLLEEC